MNQPWKGGKAKKAPYETTHQRIPEPIKAVVQMLSDRYKQLIAGGVSDPTGENLIRRVEDAICTDASLIPGNRLADALIPVTGYEEQEIPGNGYKLDKEDNDWYCRYQELLAEADLWREKADERDRFFPTLSREIENLREENAQLLQELKATRDQLQDQEQPQPQTQPASPEAIAILQKAITPEKEGGLFKSNRATPLKEAIEKALKLMEY